jgi:hypothetical protein
MPTYQQSIKGGL